MREFAAHQPRHAAAQRAIERAGLFGHIGVAGGAVGEQQAPRPRVGGHCSGTPAHSSDSRNDGAWPAASSGHRKLPRRIAQRAMAGDALRRQRLPQRLQLDVLGGEPRCLARLRIAPCGEIGVGLDRRHQSSNGVCRVFDGAPSTARAASRSASRETSRCGISLRTTSSRLVACAQSFRRAVPRRAPRTASPRARSRVRRSDRYAGARPWRHAPASTPVPSSRANALSRPARRGNSIE